MRGREREREIERERGKGKGLREGRKKRKNGERGIKKENVIYDPL